ncbi:DUF3806 domain-containing protein [Nostocoides sp. HKS02]|uniref:DUF3806 domain-containing protein n=1 Tax=Nostocoides sp. HKS02 TaxID=1813880 RepID=UPI0012B4E480|nr:DUF3806 domain-containing protein [Tetrasphaera sp. HKS02]QGN58602.1 hypothetical protein GKE56_12735 [Tetrasphaera sp. HKS02]
MAWFGRRREDSPDDAGDGPDAAELTERTMPDAGDTLDSGASLRPLVDPLGDAEQARIARALEELAAAGVDVDDLDSLGAALDREYAAWSAAPEDHRPDHAAVVERYAIGIGEHLDRHTDLDWQVVTDVFGTDLSVTEGFKGSFVVVPHNLVAGRWMRGETDWLPAVVGHIVRRRNRR